MDYKEAYRLLKKEHPKQKSGGYALFRDRLYVFLLVPNDYVPREGDMCDDFYSVDKNTGEIKPFFPIPVLDELLSSPGGRFNEKDIL